MKRRGLSTIVGATFFVIVMASTIGYVTYSLDLIDDLARQVDVKQDTNQNRQNEEFIISKVSVDGANEFNITVTNTGNIPINITRMWAKNMTDPSWNQTKYQINKFVSPGQSVINIGQGIGLVAMDSESYLLKLVTSRGNSLDTQLLSAASQPLDMRLYVTPSSPVSTSNVTLLYTVTNNLTEGKILQSLTPIIASPITTGVATAGYENGPTPASYDSLSPGEMAFFEWTYNIVGNEGDRVTFNATLANAVLGNNATDLISIIVPPVSVTSINEVLGGSVGVISMNFTSFEACEPNGADPDQDCTSDSTDWFRAWLVEEGTKYIWRMNVTNNGIEDVILEKYTTMLILRGESGAGGSLAKAMFVMKDSTTSVENSGAYTNNYKILPGGGTQTIIYFGAKNAGGSSLETTHGDVAVYAANILLFGYEDIDDNGTTNDPPDTPYSQNLPFQALRMY
ncbi:MAG: hypothetical protein O6761_02230 [Thaumarchaeota archaeon]|nr:hypothetical protein [Nitrososphaerota archaeon]